MPSPGRPRFLDETKQREILAIISAGCGVQTAARYVGCSARTIDREIRRNKDFWDLYRKAELAASINPLKTIKEAANTNWRAATWLLERKLPQSFAPTSREMIDPCEVEEMLGRFYDEICRCIPDRKLCDRILKRIHRTTQIAVHEATTKRKNPKILPVKSPLRRIPIDPEDILNPPQYPPRDSTIPTPPDGR